MLYFFLAINIIISLNEKFSFILSLFIQITLTFVVILVLIDGFNVVIENLIFISRRNNTESISKNSRFTKHYRKNKDNVFLFTYLITNV